MTNTRGFISREFLEAIASAIRTKDASAPNALFPSEMAQAILDIPTGNGGVGGVASPKFLTHSDASKVLVNDYYTDYDAATPAWSGLTIGGAPALYAGGVRVASGHGFSYPVNAQNRSITIYAIVASLDARAVSAMVMSVIAEETIGKGPNISSYEGVWRISNWSGTTIEGSRSDLFSVLTMSIDIDNSTVSFYINGARVGSKDLTASGATVRFNGSISHSSWAGSFAFLFAGIVDGCEDSATILANQADMMQFLQNGRIGIPGNSSSEGEFMKLIDLGTPNDLNWDSIDAGTFEGSPVGGYVTTNGRRYYIGHHDYWLNTGLGNTLCDKHHLLIVPANSLASGQLNSSDTQNGGYLGCDFRTGNNANTAYADIRAILETDWGNHLLSHIDYFSSAVSSNRVTASTKADSLFDLPSEIMVHGTRHWEPNVWGSNTMESNYTFSRQQIKLFRERTDLVPLGTGWWLRSTGPYRLWTVVFAEGATGVNAANEVNGFRPVFAVCKASS